MSDELSKNQGLQPKEERVAEPVVVPEEVWPKLVPINSPVYPSEEISVYTFLYKDDVYGGAHDYRFKLCGGFKDGKTEYFELPIDIHFVQKDDDGTVKPGLQSEQLVIALLDRHIKLNNRYPSDQHQKMVAGLDMFLQACKERVDARLARGVMGELKK